TDYVVYKYPGNPELYSGAVTNYAHSQKIFRIAEMYLVAAEAALRANGEAGGRGHLNSLRQARGLTAVAASGAALWNEIKDERFRELAYEGFRLDDLKRWNEGFTRRDPQHRDYINTGTNFDTKTVSANDPTFTWGIPERDDTVNGNIIQNEGW